MTSTEQLSVYVRQWHPSTLTLDLPKEVVLKDSVVEELKEEVRIIQVILSLVIIDQSILKLKSGDLMAVT